MKLKLEEAVITEVRRLINGDRVCIDTCTKMRRGQGILIGSTSRGLFLVHSESIKNPYVAPRRFRVNAGALCEYTLVEGKKTKYLSEVSAGDKILIVDYKGNAKEAVIGRSKMEKRPLILIKAMYKNDEIPLILQNAETVRLTDPKGYPISVVNLHKGSKVLIYPPEEKGRHFGMGIDETIIEK
jgi:3-dehydroquinate synthase II